MKALVTITLLMLACINSFGQQKYAFILSSASVDGDFKAKLVGGNNTKMIMKGLQSQGFVKYNMEIIDYPITRNGFNSSLKAFCKKITSRDVPFFYTDLNFDILKDGANSEVRFILNSHGEFIRLSEFISTIKAEMPEAYTNMFFVFDSQVPEIKDRTIFANVQKRFSINAAFSCAPGDTKNIEDTVSVYTRTLSELLLAGYSGAGTYRSLFTQVRREVMSQVSNQNPFVVADERILFGGMYRKSAPYFSVIKRMGSVVVINAGTSKMIFPGAKISFYDPGSMQNDENKIAEGKVIATTSSTATVSLKKPQNKPLHAAWAYVSEYTTNVMVNFNTTYKGKTETQPAFNSLLQALKLSPHKFIQEVRSGGELMISGVEKRGDSLDVTVVHPVTEFIYGKVAVHNDLKTLDPLIDLVRKHALFNVLSKLENSIPEFDVRVSLEKSDGTLPGMENGFPYVFDDDKVQLVIKNPGTSPMYYSIIDLMPDKTAALLFPEPGNSPFEYKLGPGELRKIEVIITPPYGIEKLKVISSKEPIDLRERFAGLASRSTRGAAPDWKISELNIETLEFEIRNKAFAQKKNGMVTHSVAKAASGLQYTLSNASAGSIFFNVVKEDDDGSFQVVYPNGSLSPNDLEVETGGKFKSTWLEKLKPQDQLLTIYADRPFNIMDYVNTEKSINNRILEIIRDGRISGTPLNKIAAIHSLYEEPLTATRDGGEVGIKLITPKTSSERGVSEETDNPKIDISGLAYAQGNKPVKSIKINGQAIAYDADLKLFEQTVELQTGVNKIVIEAADEKGFTATRTLNIELKADKIITAASATGKNYFLGIGINNYKVYPPLFNATLDVIDFAKLLRDKYGYITKLNLDTATRSNIIKQIREFLTKTGPNDNVIIYLSGHGNEDQLADGDYYFIPQEADPSDITTAIKSSDIIDNFKKIKAKHCLLIVDACYGGLITNNASSNPLLMGKNEDKPLDQLPSKWIITSGMATTVLDGKPGENSPFAKSLISYLNANRPESELKITRVIDFLIEEFKNKEKQKPLGMQMDGRGIMVFGKKLTVDN